MANTTTSPAPAQPSLFGLALVGWIANLDRRIIYLAVFVSLALPLIFRWTLPPAEMRTATSLFNVVDKLEPTPGKIALVALDFSPSTQAENGSQALSVIEHLMRKRIPIAFITISPYAGVFLEEYPRTVVAKLTAENPALKYEYGKDWVNLGFKPNSRIAIQNIAKATDIRLELKTDARGVPLSQIEMLRDVRTIADINLLAEFTGLVGAFNEWIQMFQGRTVRPPMVHGCTSITIPEAFIYLNSKQIVGLLEGLAGAAWYDKLLSDEFKGRKPGEALVTNTCLAVAQLMVLFLIFAGNAGSLMKRMKGREKTR